ncbi:MAG: hypothetical protein IJM68_01150 [Synergistaceae bacterium]|nr:hypothetical protein [Synergistaceae bacterium]
MENNIQKAFADKFAKKLAEQKAYEREEGMAWEEYEKVRVPAGSDYDWDMMTKEAQAYENAKCFTYRVSESKGVLSRDMLAWILEQPDFTDPDAGAPELTSETVNAAGEYLEGIAGRDEWLESLACEWRSCSTL